MAIGKGNVSNIKYRHFMSTEFLSYIPELLFQKKIAPTLQTPLTPMAAHGYTQGIR